MNLDNVYPTPYTLHPTPYLNYFMFNKVELLSWLFLVGSSIFLVDGFLELTEGFSLHALLHLSASFLFTIGSILFIPHGKNN